MPEVTTGQQHGQPVALLLQNSSLLVKGECTHAFHVAVTECRRLGNLPVSRNLFLTEGRRERERERKGRRSRQKEIQFILRKPSTLQREQDLSVRESLKGSISFTSKIYVTSLK